MANRDLGYDSGGIAKTYTDLTTCYGACNNEDRIRFYYEDAALNTTWILAGDIFNVTTVVSLEGMIGAREISLVGTSGNGVYYNGDLSGASGQIEITNLTFTAVSYAIYYNDTSGGGGGFKFHKNLCLGVNSYATRVGAGVASNVCLVENNAFIGTFCAFLVNAGGGTQTAKHNTIIGPRIGINGNNQTVILTNNLVINAANGDSFYQVGGATMSGNVSTDASGDVQKTVAQIAPWFNNDNGFGVFAGRLLTSSDIYQTGANSGVTTDWDGNARHATTPTPGCHEGRAVAYFDQPSAGAIIEGNTILGVAGTYHEATEAEVQTGVTFGANEELTGTYGTTAPAAPTIAVARLSDTSVTMTFSNTADASYTNTGRYALAFGANALTSGGTRVGDGALNITGLTSGKLYFFVGDTNDSGNFSPSSNIVLFTTGPASGATGAYATFLEDLYDEIRNSAALAAKVTDSSPNNHVKLGWQLFGENGESDLIDGGPVIYIQPQPITHEPRTISHNRCTFTAIVHIHEKFDQSAADNLITAINFNDALTTELMEEADNGGTSWLTSGTHVSVSTDGPHKESEKLDRLYTSMSVSCVWTEAYS